MSFDGALIKEQGVTFAIAYGRDIAIRQQSELVIHDRHGRIRDKDSYGNDPCPPRDTKF